MGIKILFPGALTTIQDQGRIGYQSSGFSESGVMDSCSFQMANMLLGNKNTEAVLEITLIGPTIEIMEDNLFALTGGNFMATLNGREIPRYAALLGKKGDILKLDFAKTGARAYLAFAGGLCITTIMESKSTHLKCNIGGLKGRKLEIGDEILFQKPVTELPNMYKRYEKEIDFVEKEIELRVVLGPQQEYFTNRGIDIFLESEYEVTQEYDRMGCRLKGPSIESVNGVDIISDGIALGAIQIPPSGMPIIMMSDLQTTGGYAKIATVIKADIKKLAQSKAETKIRFRAISVEEATKAWKKELKMLRKFRRAVN